MFRLGDRHTSLLELGCRAGAPYTKYRGTGMIVAHGMPIELWFCEKALQKSLQRCAIERGLVKLMEKR